MIERFSYDVEMKTREQNKNKKRIEIERFDWLIDRIQQRYFRFDVILQHDWPPNNAFSILGFSLAGKQRGHVLIFSSTGW